MFYHFVRHKRKVLHICYNVISIKNNYYYCRYEEIIINIKAFIFFINRNIINYLFSQMYFLFLNIVSQMESIVFALLQFTMTWRLIPLISRN